MGRYQVSGREQITPLGLASLIFGFLLGSSIVLPLGAIAGRDSWIAALIAGAAGLGVAWLYSTLAELCPGLSLIGYSKLLLGRWLGGLAGLLYLWYSLHLGALVLRNFGEFLIVTILPNTPLSVPIIVLMLLCGYAVRHGVETLARAALFLTIAVFVQIAVASLLVMPAARMERLLPVLEHGWAPVLQGAFTMFGFPYGEAILFAILLPAAAPLAKVKRASVLGSLAAVLLLTFIHTRNVAVVGEHLTVTARFPTLSVIRQIDIADFFTRLDAVIITTWVVTGFIKVSVCLHITVSGLAEWLGLKDDRALALPIGVIMAALSIFLLHDVSHMAAFASVWAVYSLPFQVIMPILLLAVAWLRNLLRKRSHQPLSR